EQVLRRGSDVERGRDQARLAARPGLVRDRRRVQIPKERRHGRVPEGAGETTRQPDLARRLRLPARVGDHPLARRARATAGSATTSATTRKASVETTLPTQIALRSDGASTSPSSTPCSRSATKARPRPSSAVNRIATQSSPSDARCEAFCGSAKWKTTSTEI